MEHPDIAGCIRSNSGANAGHTVVIDGVTYKFHAMPSGVLHEGKWALINDDVVIDPVVFYDKEVHPLEKNKVNLEKLGIGDCDVVMPWHKIDDLCGDPDASTGQ